MTSVLWEGWFWEGWFPFLPCPTNGNPPTENSCSALKLSNYLQNHL